MDHDAIRPEVHPAFVGVARDVEASRAEVAAAVELVPLRGGEDRAVDLVPAEHVLEDRTVLDDLGGDCKGSPSHALLPEAPPLLRRGGPPGPPRGPDPRERAPPPPEHADNPPRAR